MKLTSKGNRLVMAAAVTATVLSGSPATATNWGSGESAGPPASGVWFTPNADWMVGRRDLTTSYQQPVYDAVKQQYEPTDLTTTVYSPTACMSVYDVCVFDWDYGDNGLYGWNDCIGTRTGSHPNQVCSQDYVRMNLYALTHYPPHTTKAISCHELGHSVGLRHSSESTSCMNTVYPLPETTTSHDRAHINGKY